MPRSKSQLREYNQRYYVTTGRKRYLKQKYGLTQDAFNAMLEAQNFACKICQRRYPQEDLKIDHCHSTDRVRGILCHKCNVMLGEANDDQAVLLRAIQYLKGESI